MCYWMVTIPHSKENLTQVLGVIKTLPYVEVETSKRALPAIAGSDLKDVNVAIFALEEGKFSIGIQLKQSMTQEKLLADETIKRLPKDIISDLIILEVCANAEEQYSYLKHDIDHELSGMLCAEQIEIGDPIRWFYTGIKTWKPQTVDSYLGINKY